jgi:hypothetical protein
MRGMPRYSLKSIFGATALIAVEAFLTREMVFMPRHSASQYLPLAWLLYGILFGGGLLAIVTRGNTLALMIGLVLGGFGQVFLWGLLWGARIAP